MKKISALSYIILIISLSSHSIQAQTTNPSSIPSQDEIISAYNSLFNEDAKKASASRSPKDWHDFANKLLDAAKMTKENPAFQGLLCEKAYEFAMKDSSGAELAISAMKILIDVQPDRKSEARAKIIKAMETLYQTSPPAEKNKAGTALLEEYFSLIDDKLLEDKSADAMDLCRKALPLATALKSDRAGELTTRLNISIAIDKINKDVALLEAAVKADPSNDVKIKQLILIYVVDKNDPAKAVPLIDSAGDEATKTYVPIAVKPVSDLAEPVCLELAEWYKGLSEKAGTIGKPQMLSRAVEYYKRFLELHKAQDVDALKAGKALDAVEKELAKCTAVPTAKPALPKGAVLAFNFDKNNILQKDGKTYVKDLSGKDNHGEIINAKMVDGRKGQAFDFSNDGTIEVADADSLNVKEITICLWVKPTEDLDSKEWRGLFVKQDQYVFVIPQGNIFRFRIGTGNISDTKTKEWKKDVWYFLSVTYDGKKLTMYINGAKDMEKTPGVPIPATQNKIIMGLRNGPGMQNKFILDDVMMFDRVLSDSEIAVLAKK